uniref:Uncharacterized protein n=1 Tax=Rhizophora mucronata TaxID=61149 RepID=A0A2P2P8N5_RHIMU
MSGCQILCTVFQIWKDVACYITISFFLGNDSRCCLAVLLVGSAAWQG